MKNWTDEEFLNFLLTSDFDDNFSPEELKSFLIKLRYFFRIVSSRQNNIELEKKRFDSEIEQMQYSLQENRQISNARIQKLEQILESLMTRKLTFKERFLGRISPKSNEVP